jgi:hypothetical protein
MNDWYVEVKIIAGVLYPYTPCKEPIQSDVVPFGNYMGPFHCKDCAKDCASFGKTERQAWEYNHGTDDEKFAAFLGYA